MYRYIIECIKCWNTYTTRAIIIFTPAFHDDDGDDGVEWPSKHFLSTRPTNCIIWVAISKGNGSKQSNQGNRMDQPKVKWTKNERSNDE